MREIYTVLARQNFRHVIIVLKANLLKLIDDVLVHILTLRICGNPELINTISELN